MRAFVAVDVPLTTPLISADRSVPSSPDHLTLRFFGDLADDLVQAVMDRISEVAGATAPFSITIAGVDAFPSRGDPKIVWRGITDGRGALLDLVAALNRGLSDIGLPAEPRPFVPHLTWFRVRSDRDRSLAREMLRAEEGPPGRSVRVDAIVLKESTLTPDGPAHRAIARAELRGRSGPG